MSHIIPPYSSSLIGIDSFESPLGNSNNNNNTNPQNLVNGSRFYLAQFSLNENSTDLSQLISNYFHQVTIQWSRSLKIDLQLADVFLPIPGTILNYFPV